MVTSRRELMIAYPDAWEDIYGTIWVSRQAAAVDDDYDSILGWSWDDAVDNLAYSIRLAKKRAFWAAHPRLRVMSWWTLRHYRACALFLRLVWRRTGYFPKNEDSRFTCKQTWEIASGIWLK